MHPPRVSCVTLHLTIAAVLAMTSAVFLASPGLAQENGEEYQFLFVQSASSGSYDGTRLTMEKVGPTILFTDRPQRITGHMRTDHFVRQWGVGADSFREDPPNAALSIYSADALETLVVEIGEPRLEGTTLSYGVKVLDGKLPREFGESTLFIDVLGRGAAFVGGAVVGGAVAHSRDQKATTSQPTYTTTTSPPPTSPECTEAQQQLLAAQTEEQTKIATQKVQAICRP